jgi:hypothetical protein
MASQRILAVGKIINGNTEFRVAAVIETDSLVYAAINFGRSLYAAGASRSACVNENEEIGYDEAEWEHYQEQMMAQDAAALPALQEFIDFVAEAEELEDAIDDNIWHSRGGW